MKIRVEKTGSACSSTTYSPKNPVPPTTKTNPTAHIANQTHEESDHTAQPPKQSPRFHRIFSPLPNTKTAHTHPSPTSRQPHPRPANPPLNPLPVKKCKVISEYIISKQPHMFSNSTGSCLRHEPHPITHHWSSSNPHSDLQIAQKGDQAHPKSLIKSVSPPQKSNSKPKRTSSGKLFAQAHRVAPTETFLPAGKPHPEPSEKQSVRTVQKAVSAAIQACAKPTGLGLSHEFQIHLSNNHQKMDSLSQIILNFEESGLSSIKEGDCERRSSETDSESLLGLISA